MHDDHNPSMHVSWTATEHGGRTLVYCHACGDSANQEDWADWLGLEYDDLFDDRRWSLHHRREESPVKPVRVRKAAKRYSKLGPLPKPIAAPARAEEPSCAHEYQLVETYGYENDQGLVDHKVLRKVCSTCGDKEFPQRYLVDTEWSTRAPTGFQSRLYRHGVVAQAARDGQDVWLCEGEKDVHAAEAAGLVATTNAGGAPNFPARLAPVLTGAHVTVVMDRDTAGYARGAKVHATLTEAGAATVRLVLPTVTKPGADLHDHLTAGHGLDEVVEVPVSAAAAWASLGKVQDAVTRLTERIESEVHANLEQARHDAKNGRKAKAADRRRFAERWVREAFNLHVRLVETAREVCVNALRVPGDHWAEEAAEIAVSVTRSATTITAGLFTTMGQDAPPEIEESYRLLLELHGQIAAAATATVAAPEAVPAAAGSGGSDRGWTPQVLPGGGGDGPSRRGVRISGPNYQVVLSDAGRLEIVELKTEGRRRPGEDEEAERIFSQVLNCKVTVVERQFAESVDAVEDTMVDLNTLGDRDFSTGKTLARELPKQSHVVVEVQAAEDDEPARFRVPFDQYMDGSFIAHLQVPGLRFNSSRAGRDRVVAAVNALSTAAQIVTCYRATGWRTMDDGHDAYITANGAITSDGWVPLPVGLSGPLARYDLPMPTQDVPRLREAFLEHSAALMTQLPERVGVALIGTIFRGVICPSEWSTVLTGSPGSYKTSVASLAMHHLGELWDRTKPLTSLSGNGATLNALRLLLNQAKDSVVFLDDNAPTTGYEAANKRLEELLRLISNGESRPRAERDGSGVLEGAAPRCTGLVTSEVPGRPGASGTRRGFDVPLNRGEITRDMVMPLDRYESRHARALLTSSFLQWVAQGSRAHALQRLVGLREQYLDWLQSHPRATVSHQRLGAHVSELYAGWGLLLDFLKERQILNAEECQQWQEKVANALFMAAAAAEDPDLVSTTGQRACELLQYALANGLAYATDITDNGAPEGLERRLGWTSPNPRTNQGTTPLAPLEWRRPDRAIHLGYVNLSAQSGEEGAEMVCTRSALEATLKIAAAAMADTTTLDLGTVLRALREEGILKTGISKSSVGTAVANTLARVIPCETDLNGRPIRAKRVVLRLEQLLGSSDEDPEDPDPQQQPHPPAPGAGPRPAPPPTPVDGLAAPIAGVTPEAASGSEPEEKSDEMREHANSSGLTLPAVHSPSAPCVACSIPAGFTFAGLSMHLPCFWASRETSTTELRARYLLTGETTHTPSVEAPPAIPTREAPAARPRKTTAAATPDSAFAASVVVVDVESYYLPGKDPQPHPFPITHAGHLEQLGRVLNLGAAPLKWRTKPEAGLVVPTPELLDLLGVPTDPPTRPNKRREWFTQVSHELPFLTAAAQDGWVFGRGDTTPVLRGMTRLRRSEAERGSIAILYTPGMPTDWGLGNVDAGAIARRLELFAQTVGLPFRASPISTGLDLLRILLPYEVRTALNGQEPVDYTEIEPAHMAAGEPLFDWTRAPHREELDQTLALFDRGGSYLSGWSSLKIGIGAPEHHDGVNVRFDPARAGWWQIRLPKRDEGARDPFPNLLDPQGNRAGVPVWVTTPVLEYGIGTMGLDVEFLQSWTWPAERSKAWLKGLYEVLRDALAKLREMGGEDAKATSSLVKLIYKQLCGHFISADSDLRSHPELAARSDSIDMHHPYAYHAMRGKARVAILHQILSIGTRTGTWPLVVSNNDLLGYAAETKDPQKAWPGEPSKLGYGLGQYKLDRWAPLEEHQQYLTGKGWSGLDSTHVNDGPRT